MLEQPSTNPAFADALAVNQLMRDLETVSTITQRLLGHNGQTQTPGMHQLPDLDKQQDAYRAVMGLTSRQLEVLVLLAEGYSNKAIAEILALGIKSVENYINNIFQELNLSRGSFGNEQLHPRVKAALYYRDYIRYAHAVLEALRQHEASTGIESEAVAT